MRDLDRTASLPLGGIVEILLPARGYSADNKLTIATLRSATQTPYYVASEAYDFGVSVYSPKFRAEPEEIETYFALSGIKAKPQDFVDNSILNELDCEGFFEQVNKQYGLR